MCATTAFAQCQLPRVAADAVTHLTAEQLVEAGHYRRAIEVLGPVVVEQSKNGRALWLLSRAKSYTGELDEALKLAEAALATDTANAAFHVQVAAVAGRMAQTASLLKQLGLARRVKKELDEAVKLDQRNTDAQWGLMMYYFAAPSMLGGDKAKTQQISEDMARSTPALGAFYQGRLAHEMKDAVKEEQFYKQSIVIDPMLYDAVAALMELYLERRDLARAEVWACQAVHVDPTRGQGWSALARIYALHACWTEAADAAMKFEAIDPHDAGPWYAIATGALERGEQTETAEAHLRKYLSRPPEGNQPTHATAHWQLGLALEKQGKHRRCDHRIADSNPTRLLRSKAPRPN